MCIYLWLHVGFCVGLYADVRVGVVSVFLHMGVRQIALCMCLCAYRSVCTCVVCEHLRKCLHVRRVCMFVYVCVGKLLNMWLCIYVRLNVCR